MIEKILRHTWLERITHWIVAISGLLLLFSGFGQMPMYKRYNIIKIPGLSWANNYELTLIMHLSAAFFFTAAVCFHILYHYRRKEFAALPKKGDFSESIHIIWAMIRGKAEPPHGKFLAEQRLAYAAIGFTTMILIFTGIIKTYKNLGSIVIPHEFLSIITLIHTFAGMLFMLLFIAHVGAFIIKANWPLFPSMFTGYVKKDYAQKRHQKWNIDHLPVKKNSN